MTNVGRQAGRQTAFNSEFIVPYSNTFQILSKQTGKQPGACSKHCLNLEITHTYYQSINRSIFHLLHRAFLTPRIYRPRTALNSIILLHSLLKILASCSSLLESESLSLFIITKSVTHICISKESRNERNID